MAKPGPRLFPDNLVQEAADGRKLREQRQAEDPYRRWQQSQDPADLYQVVESHRPIIERAAQVVTGPRDNPLVRRRAMLMAAEAVKSFDPKRGVPLKHHIQSQLSGLNRYSRDVGEAIPVPERLRRETAILHRAQEELWAQLDREPTADELADHTGISIRQQQKLQRRARRSLAEGALQQMAGEEEEGDYLPGVSRPDLRQEMTDYVYFDLDPVDKLVFEYRTGYGGRPVLPNQEVARKLKLSPGAVSQRAARIETRIQELMDAQR